MTEQNHQAGSLVDEFNQRYGSQSAEEILALVFKTWPGEVAFASSFGLEDTLLQHMLLPWAMVVETVVLDTGRLPPETYDLIERWRRDYQLKVQIMTPRAELLQPYLQAHGPNAFYRSLDLRQECCYVRKVEPLERALRGKKAWISGLRRGQSVTRSGLKVFTEDEAGRVKISPLAAWSEEQVWAYIRAHDVPYNRLHDRGYPSIGCAPCTRAVAAGEEARAGRWWWETDAKKECGLHNRPSGQEGKHADASR